MAPASRFPIPLGGLRLTARFARAAASAGPRPCAPSHSACGKSKSGSPEQRSEVRLTKQTNRMCPLVSQ
jgi:hypothetical protein